jgi:hypothetical protein
MSELINYNPDLIQRKIDLGDSFESKSIFETRFLFFFSLKSKYIFIFAIKKNKGCRQHFENLLICAPVSKEFYVTASGEDTRNINMRQRD